MQYNDLNNNPGLSYSALVVEDQAVNQALLTELLQDFEISSTICNDGLEALHYLEQHSSERAIDLILMDCHMPKMDGYKTSQAIRKSQAGIIYENTPIIALTANAGEEEEKKCLASGMNAHLTKPIDPDLLEKQINFFLSPDRKADPNASRSELSSNKTDETDIKVWDYTSFYKRIGSKPKRAEMLIKQYLNNAPSDIQELINALNHRDFIEAKRIAHRAKGAAAIFSAHSLITLLHSIESSPEETPTNSKKTLEPTLKELIAAMNKKLNNIEYNR